MAITINNLEILNNGSQLAIDVETDLGYLITNIDIWLMNTFKDYSLAININSFLQNINNKEVLIINASEVGVLKFEDIFTEITSDAPSTDENCTCCTNPVMGITYNLAPYYNCLLSNLLELQLTQCINCAENKSKDMVIMLNMLIDNTIKCIEIGYYMQAIEMINKMKRLCSIKICNNCPTIDCPSCRNFIQI